jgi:hypothetical protein
MIATGSGWLSSRRPGPPASRNAVPSRPAAARRGAGQIEPGRQVLYGERRLGQLGRPVRRQAGQDPVDRAEPRGVGGGVYEERQPEVPRPRAQARRPGLRLQVHIGGVPVVAVGDEGPAPAQVGGDRGLLGRIPDPPQAVRHAIIGVDGHQRRPVGRDSVDYLSSGPAGNTRRRASGVARLRAVVDQEDRL